MKYSMHSCVLSSYDWDQAIIKAAKIGYDGYEIDLTPGINNLQAWNKYIESWFDRVPGIQKIMSDEQIEISSVCLGNMWFVDIAGGEKEERLLGEKMIKDTICLAGKLDSKCILVPISESPGLSNEAARQNISEIISRCIEDAEQNNVIIAIENVTQRMLQNADDLIVLLKMINSEYCKIYYDVGNPYYIGLDPVQEIDKLGEMIYQIHVKDMEVKSNAKKVSTKPPVPQGETAPFKGNSDYWMGYKNTIIGQGLVDWEKINESIKRIKYNEYLVMEVNQLPDEPDQVAEECISAMKEIVCEGVC